MPEFNLVAGIMAKCNELSQRLVTPPGEHLPVEHTKAKQSAKKDEGGNTTHFTN